MSGTDRLRRAWPSLVFLAIAIAVHAPAWTNPSRRAFCGCGDLAFATWFFSWTPYAVLHGHNPLFTDWLNHPYGVNVMWNVSLPLPGLLMAPVTLAFGPVATYNVLSAVGFWTAGWAAYAVIRRWAPWHPAAFVGGPRPVHPRPVLHIVGCGRTGITSPSGSLRCSSRREVPRQARQLVAWRASPSRSFARAPWPAFRLSSCDLPHSVDDLIQR